MEFNRMQERLNKHFETVLADKTLYEVSIDKDELWNVYLDSFPDGTNVLFRMRREYDCSCCRHFIKSIGHTVWIDENLDVHSVFEFDTGSPVFQPVMDALAEFVKSKPIMDFYLTDARTVGTYKNDELCDNGTVITWHHMYAKVPERSIIGRDYIGTQKGLLRDRRNVFKRSLEEIDMDAIDTVLELITSNTLYKGEEWKDQIRNLKEFKNNYAAVPDDKKDLYTWRWAALINDSIGKIRNHSIGVLLTDISEGMDLDTAVRRYEKIVAPTNYKRPKAIFTKRMLEDAKKTITELGYMDSLQRRYATLDDITVNNILFSNRDAAKRIAGDVFDDMMADIPVKQFSKVEEVSVDKFVSDILPTAREIEVLLENKHAQNMVSLIAPANKDAKTMFKWDNGFSWAYSGNITDSDIRENVKSAGGNVDGVLRFSIQWNDGEVYDGNDLDAHCVIPSIHGEEIYFGHRHSLTTGGWLDVDIIDPKQGKAAVENIAFPSKSKMKNGKYIFGVHCYSNRGGRSGFRAEIEFDGKIYSYNYTKPLKQKEVVRVADVDFDAYTGNFTIKEYLNSAQASRDVWGLKTNTFVPVTVIMYSPNYWDDQHGIGHRHYFFMLKDCVNPENPNGFYNEFLKNDLEKHKRVLEALGSKLAVESADDQLSGLGFSATKRNDLTVKVKGATERIIKIKF